MSLHTILHDWIVLISGYAPENVIRGRQSGPRPTGDYATYYLLSTSQNVFTSWKKTDLEVDDDISVNYYKPKDFYITVDVYAGNGYEILDNLEHSKELLAARSLLAAGGLTLFNRAADQDLTGLGDTTWRPRFNATFAFGAYNEISEVNQKILRYVLVGELGDLETTIDTGG